MQVLKNLIQFVFKYLDFLPAKQQHQTMKCLKKHSFLVITDLKMKRFLYCLVKNGVALKTRVNTATKTTFYEGEQILKIRTFI